jgi:sec-independent protein translocase protein TatC
MSAAAASAATLPLRAHLREARRRGTRAAAAVVVGVAAGFWLGEPVLDVLRAPIEQLAATTEASLNYDTISGAFDLRVTIALYLGVVLAAPVLLYQALAYVLPGLTRREKRYTVGFLAAAVVLFAVGCAVGLAAFPHMVELLAGFASAEDSTILQASQYVDFVLKLVLATGAAFTLPVVMVLLNVLGLLSAHAIVRAWRGAVVAIVAVSALITPSADVVSMLVLSVALTGLYFTACAIARFHERLIARRRSDRIAAQDPQEELCSD